LNEAEPSDQMNSTTLAELSTRTRQTILLRERLIDELPRDR